MEVGAGPCGLAKGMGTPPAGSQKAGEENSMQNDISWGKGGHDAPSASNASRAV
jgi:hypothetical protein